MDSTMNPLKLRIVENDNPLCVDVSENIISTSTENGCIALLDAKNKHEIIDKIVITPEQEVPTLCFKKSFPHHLYSASGNYVYLHDTRKFNNPVLKLNFNSDDINHLIISHCEKYLCSADDSGSIKVIFLNDSKLYGSIDAHNSSCFTLKIRPNSCSEVLSGGHDCKIHRWDFLNKKKIQSFNLVNINNDLLPCINPPYVLSVDFSSNGNLIAAGLQNGSLCLWKTKCNQFRKLRSFPDAHSTLGLTQVHFFKNSPLFVTGGNDGAIKIWNSRKTDSIPLNTVFHGYKINWLTTLLNTSSLIVCDISSYLTIYKNIIQ